MIKQINILLPAFKRGYHLITDLLFNEIGELPQTGLINFYITHTSAALTINENADPSVRADFETIADDLIPDGNIKYQHSFEGDDDMPAHFKSSIFGASVTIPVSDGKPALGLWQGIYLCEFRNSAGRRNIIISIYQ